MTTVDRLVSALHDAIIAENNAAIIEAGNQLLALNDSDVDAFQAVVTAHLNESEYSEAYAIIQKMPQMATSFPFIHSYCLYRLNKFEDALAIIGTGKLDNANVALKAQCLYRCCKYAEVISLYTDLLDDPDFNRTELLTNICAAAACAGLSRDFLKQYREELGESVDLLYNSCCASIEAGENALASDFLRRAEAAGQQNELEDDDVAVLKCQRAYLDYCSGNTDVAMASFKSIVSNKPSDQTVVVVAQNNVIVGSRDRKAFDSIKALRSAYAESVKFRLTAKQNRIIDMNMLLLLLSGGTAEIEQCRKLCSVRAASLDAPTASIKATLLFLEKKTDSAIALLKPFLANGPLSLKLLSAQMSIHQNDLPAAIAILEDIVKEDTLRLGIVSALSKLHVAAGDMAAGIAVIDATIKRAKGTAGLWPLIQDAVRLHEEAGNVQSAAAALEKYSGSGPRKYLTLAHLVELTARFDSDKAEKLSLGLPSLPIDPSIDVDVLENASSRRSAAAARSVVTDMNSARKSGAVDVERLARIRVRRKVKKMKALKKRLGAAFNSKHQPDINKWLPFADRPGSKRRNWKKDAVRGSQGAAAPASSAVSAASAVAAAVGASAVGGGAPQKTSSKGRR